MVTGSHSKTIAFGGIPSLDGKQLFRQYERFDSHSFIAYLEDVKKKFKKFIIFADRATQHRSQVVKDYLQGNLETIRKEYFPVGSPEFNAVEECWSQGKCSILSNCPYSLSHLKEIISQNTIEQEGLTLTSKSICLGPRNNVCQYRLIPLSSFIHLTLTRESFETI